MITLAGALSLPVILPVIVAAQPPAATLASATRAATPVLASSYTADRRLRSSRIIGASVYNERNEKLGTIDDVLVAGQKEASGLVLSVGGFLGIAIKLVEVPMDRIQIANGRVVMAGASKDRLVRMPDYRYGAS
jgi:sporulation protein YlmC with PRC-barrel domain